MQIQIHDDAQLEATDTTSVEEINRSERIQRLAFFVIAGGEVLAACVLGFLLGKGLL